MKQWRDEQQRRQHFRLRHSHTRGQPCSSILTQLYHLCHHLLLSRQTRRLGRCSPGCQEGRYQPFANGVGRKDRRLTRMLFCDHAMTAGMLLWHPMMARKDPKYLGPVPEVYPRMMVPVAEVMAPRRM